MSTTSATHPAVCPPQPAPTPLWAARSLPHALEGSWRDDKRDTNLLSQSALGEGGTMTRENQEYGPVPRARLVAPHAHGAGLPWHLPFNTRMPCKARLASSLPGGAEHQPAYDLAVGHEHSKVGEVAAGTRGMGLVGLHQATALG